MTDRQIPKWSELKPLLRAKPLRLSPTDRRLEDALTIGDLRTVARKRTPRSVFDYTDGAAEGEISLRRARSLFRNLEFRPSILHDVSGIDTTTTMLGKPSSVPFSFAPTGFTRMMHHEGERAVVRVAERRGIPYALSTMGTTSIEEVAKAAPDARKWFQLYVWKDRSAGEDLMARAKAAGFEALQLTVDVPVAGARLRDARNGFSIPPALTVKTVLDAGMHPAWWINLLTTEPLKFASLSTWDGTVAELLDKLFDPSMTIADLEWLRASWDGPLIIKGIQTVDDARRVVDAGADAIVLSNHGGRQLDRAPVPVRLLPDVAEAIDGRAEVWVDTGIMSGADVVAALALGADATMVGRAYLYGLMAGGERGVDRAAEILSREVRRTMALLGVSSVSELGPQHVRLP
ncbi:alpha-hydroxy acid oxidase [Cellulomonas fimi]|uniref:FMN-dependent alpha-hydroxy acid dehydrogenase n=1 Tax=Cellulomonas fimi (strain ATCC 484 / DSM 20113 / JCM 1341 / CCUG 24087 / LMG 16345 / NBRC 15513 / NCIMB 8980 / NCTC 7547 / NRS-133) TaxID=590998 RepID=F4GYJ3_CELFA|nr:alpha-hydroxy acid oxidase [Cellulomonas fimi]AEE47110.1 FMN-dependent alpha-hydroxy acid dehydrogenase [Cellulomonas fimi ATCC 484]NNH05602.1 alpha-hydroxy-acid oxidizing protein [Cellulomonas fimi]